MSCHTFAHTHTQTQTYGPFCAQMGRVWTCGGSSAFASFKEWTQQGVLLGSQSMRLTGKFAAHARSFEHALCNAVRPKQGYSAPAPAFFARFNPTCRPCILSLATARHCCIPPRA